MPFVLQLGGSDGSEVCLKKKQISNERPKATRILQSLVGQLDPLLRTRTRRRSRYYKDESIYTNDEGSGSNSVSINTNRYRNSSRNGSCMSSRSKTNYSVLSNRNKRAGTRWNVDRSVFQLRRNCTRGGGPAWINAYSTDSIERDQRACSRGWNMIKPSARSTKLGPGLDTSSNTSNTIDSEFCYDLDSSKLESERKQTNATNTYRHANKTYKLNQRNSSFNKTAVDVSLGCHIFRRRRIPQNFPKGSNEIHKQNYLYKRANRCLESGVQDVHIFRGGSRNFASPGWTHDTSLLNSHNRVLLSRFAEKTRSQKLSQERRNRPKVAHSEEAPKIISRSVEHEFRWI